MTAAALTILALLTAPNSLTVDFIDVGQGDATLVTAPHGAVALIDGGPPSAERRVLPLVRAAAAGRRPALVVLTHPHLDHLAGLFPVLRYLGADLFLDTVYPSVDAAPSALRRLAAIRARRLLDARRERHLELEPGVTLDVLWPPQGAWLSGTRDDVNANSLVLMLRHGRARALFMGDASALRRTGAEVHRTDLHGPLRITSDGAAWHIVPDETSR